MHTMRKILAINLLVLVALVPDVHAKGPIPSESHKAHVERVYDGDTIKVRLLPQGRKLKVRLLGIDCPESHHNRKCERDGRQGRKGCDQQIPLGKKATKRAKELLDGNNVKLESKKRDGKFKLDVFGRLLAYIRMADGRDFGLVMVKEGLCEDFGWKYPHPRGKEYRKAQKAR